MLFIDEPETNLHPAAARALVRMLHDVSLAGVQIFLATHSYFILKQLELVARQHQLEVRLCALTNRDGHVTGSFHDLAEGMPPNEIVEEDRAMGDEDVDLTMAGRHPWSRNRASPSPLPPLGRRRDQASRTTGWRR